MFMKKFYALIVAGAFATSLNAQNTIQQFQTGAEKTIKSSIAISKTPTDTVGPGQWAGQATIVGSTCGGYIAGTGVLGCTSTPASFGTTAQGYLMGYPNFAGGATSYKIEEVLLWTYSLEEGGSPNTGNVTVTINAIDDSSKYSGGGNSYAIACPGTQLATTTIPWANLDTASGLSVASLGTPLYVAADYAVVVNSDACIAAGDTVGYITSASGDEVTAAHQWFLYPASTPFYTQMSHVWGSGSAPWDRMFGYWPVVDASNSIEEAGFINGISMAVSPNPAINQVKIQYAIQDNNNVKVAIFDLTGKVVYEMTESNVAANTTNNVRVDVSQLPAGNYYVSLVANGERMTQKLVLTK